VTVVPLDTRVGAAIGNDAGWALSFHSDRSLGPERAIGPAKLLISRDDYYAEIRATLPGDFSGGRYTFTIEGVTGADYDRLRNAKRLERRAEMKAERQLLKA